MLNVMLLKIPVTDLSRSVAFYEAALGLTSAFVVEAYGWAQLDGAQIPIALYVPGRGGGDGQAGGDLDFHLSHSHLEEVYDRARQADPSAKIVENDDGTRSLDLADPDGNRIRLFQTG